MRSFLPRFIVILIIANLVAACSSNSTTTAPPAEAEAPATQVPPDTSNNAPKNEVTGVDACAVLTKADAEAILGGPVNEPEHPVEGEAMFIVTSCSYHFQTESSSDRVSLIVSVSASGSPATAETALNMDRNSANESYGVAPVDIPGLGDGAIWIGGSGNYISVLKGYTYATLRSTNYQGETPARPLIDLAQAVVSRLP